ncbi:hypothetical protein H2198_003749 [Neophaeococcomyces mojaviensis]|uniref:Uncharacterized protein n=1 Tax=Neophaeococcomyces mojaviensis TaxID=3383035 RepID=A0ACC3AAR1_9EURO|nr:hypothetical protein H2198_003749 [Knufia sp. JES_112]
MEYVRNTLAQNMGGVAHNLAPEESKFDIEKDVPDQSGKVAIITGGSDGIGYAASFTLLKNNIKKLFIISLSQEVFDGALKDVTEKLGANAGQRITWIQCDIADLPAVAKAAKQIRDSTDRLDILCLNAGRGIMTYQLTESGVDRHMMANHVGSVVLTSHLLPLLKKTAESSKVRIEVQGSNAHESAPKDTKFASIDELNQDLGPNPQYGRSKLANILYARYLDRHLHSAHPNILINATHPGVVDTKMSTRDIHEPYPVGGYAMSVGMQPFKKDQWEGSASLLFAATATERSGEYICPPAMVEPGSELSRDEALGEQLMKLTREIVKTKFGSESVEKGCPLKDY